MSTSTSSAAPAATAAGAAAAAVVTVTKAEVVSISTWLLLVTSSLAMLARLSTRLAVSRRLLLDDGLSIAALCCHICSGVAVTVLANNGLGVDIDSLSSHRKQIFSQSAFASYLLAIGTLCFAKLSIVLLFNQISHQRNIHRILSKVCAGFISLWGAASLIGAAFLCEAPATWDLFGKCYDPAAFWYAFGIISIMIDVGLITVPAIIILPLHTARSKKAMMLMCFATRLCEVGATIALLSFTEAYTEPNFTAALWPWMLCCQFVQCMSIIASCVPYLKPLLESLSTGMYMPDEIRRKGTNAEISADGYIRTPEPALALSPVTSLQSKSDARNFSLRSNSEIRNFSLRSNSDIRNFSLVSNQRPMITISDTHVLTRDDVDGGPIFGAQSNPWPLEGGIRKTTLIECST